MFQEDVFLLIGFQIFTDARMKRFSMEHRRTNVGLTVPVELPQQLDSGFALNKQSEQSRTTSFGIPGEQVYSVQFRRMKFKWFSRRKVETVFPESKNCWVSVNT
jgi:hypothetical protein